MSRELLIQCPDGQMKTVPLTGGRLSIGRSSAAELCFPEDAGLSRQHFAFEPEGEDWTVQDLGSKNGTFVNNIPLKARLILKPGDRVTAGHLVIVYAPDAADPTPESSSSKARPVRPPPPPSSPAWRARSPTRPWPSSAAAPRPPPPCRR